MQKACREAKINTSWQEPNHAYEESIRGFVDGVFQRPEFIASLERFIDPLIPSRPDQQPGSDPSSKWWRPGVPDFYQGTELWDLSLVDPDNRRPVDFELRARNFRRASRGAGCPLPTWWRSGIPDCPNCG